MIRLAGLNMAVNKRGQLGFGQGADFGRLDIAVFEQHQGGNAANAVFRRRGLIAVDIKFGYPETPVVFPGDFFQHWSNRLAWSAPLCPVVHQYRQGGLQYFSFKSVISDVMNMLAHGTLIQAL